MQELHGKLSSLLIPHFSCPLLRTSDCIVQIILFDTASLSSRSPLHRIRNKLPDTPSCSLPQYTLLTDTAYTHVPSPLNCQHISFHKCFPTCNFHQFLPSHIPRTCFTFSNSSATHTNYGHLVIHKQRQRHSGHFSRFTCSCAHKALPLCMCTST